MSEILLVNPRRRRRKSSSRKRRRASSKRRRRPVAAAPKRRRRRSRSVRRVRSRRRSNPSLRGFSLRGVQGQVMGAVPGAIGALGLDVLLGFVPIPANFKAGILGYVTKGVGAIALGLVANMVGVRGSTASKMTEGALTVMIHGALRQGVAQFAPMVPLAAYPDEMLGYSGSGWNPNYDGMSAYIPGAEAMQAESVGEYAYDAVAEEGGYY